MKSFSLLALVSGLVACTKGVPSFEELTSLFAAPVPDSSSYVINDLSDSLTVSGTCDEATVSFRYQVQGQVSPTDIATTDASCVNGRFDYVINPAGAFFGFAAGVAEGKTLTLIAVSPALHTAQRDVSVAFLPITNPSIFIANTSANEGETLEFTVSLSLATGVPVTFNYETYAGTAGAGDFSGVTLTGSIPALSLSTVLRVRSIEDGIDEYDESFDIALSSATNGIIAQDVAQGLIMDDDAGPSVFIANAAAVLETGTATFAVSLSAASGKPVEFDYVTLDGTAVAAQDFSGTAGTRVTLAAGVTNYTISISAIDDSRDEEPSEVFIVSLAALVGSNPGDLAGSGSILDNDNEPGIFVSDASGIEGGSLDFVVSLSTASDRPVSFRVNTADGAGATAALAGIDYTAVTAADFTFSAGAVAMTIPVWTLPDTRDEADETFRLNLSLANFATVSDAQGLGVISDDDAEPGLYVSDAAAVTEGQTSLFVVTLSAISGRDVAFNYQTVDGSAVSTQDYTSQAGQATVFAGQAGVTIPVVTVDDNRDESLSETFTLSLTGAVNASLADDTAGGSINDNDNPPQIFITDSSATEGVVMTFVVSVSALSDLPIQFAYAQFDGTGVDKALAGTDYDATPGSGTVGAGAWSTNVSVATMQDTLYEGVEKFVVSLASADSASIADALADGRINPDADAQPVLTVWDSSASEGDTIGFTASLSALSGVETVLVWRTYDGSADGSDYTAIGVGTATILALQSSVSLPVITTEDSVNESDETVLVSIVSAAIATFDPAAAVGEITNDDGAPQIYIVDATAVTEGNSSVFLVSLTAPSGVDVTFNYQTYDDTAVSTQDYVAVGATSATISAGQLTASITIATSDDSRDEVGTEYFRVSLAALANANIGDVMAEAGINDDDNPPLLYIFDHAGGPEGSTQYVVVSLSAISDLNVDFSYSTFDYPGPDPATASEDYSPAANIPLQITAGLVPAAISIPVLNIDDDIDELTEKFLISLSAVTNADEGDYLAEVPLFDSDPTPALSLVINNPWTEGDTATFVVTLSGRSSREVSFDYYSQDSSALAGADYDEISVTRGTIPALSLAVTIPSATIEDSLFEFTESYWVRIQNPSSTATGSPVSTINIVDDDTAPFIYVQDTAGSEGDSIGFVVSLSAISGRNAPFNWVAFDGTASLASGDYTMVSGHTTIMAGSGSVTIWAVLDEDSVYENDESFTVSLSNLTWSQPGDMIATGTIINDDPKPLIYISDSSASEGETVSFTVSLNVVSGINTVVQYSTSDGQAMTADNDYASIVAESITIIAGTLSTTATVITTEDGKHEGDEEFLVGLSASGQADPGDVAATGTINNDDMPPELRIWDVAVTEGETASFLASLSAVSGVDVIFSWSTDNSSTASLSDYTSVAAVTVTIPAGQITVNLEVQTTDDSLDEDNEAFSVIASIDSGASLYLPLPTGYINDGDAAPTLNIIAGEPVDEGGTGLFIVSLSAESGREVSFDYYTQDSSAQAPGDYTAVNATRGTLLPGQMTFAIEVPVGDDEVYEPSGETFQARITNPSATASIGADMAALTINDTDPMPGLFISDAIFAEGDSLAFVVTLSHLSAVNSTFTFQTLPGIGPNAAGASDYGGITMAGQVDSGQLSATIYVENKEDTLFEEDENFLVTLVGLGNVLAEDTGAVGTIGDDDAAPSLSIGPIAVTEGQSAAFMVNISALSGRDTVFSWQTYDLTTAGDFTPVSLTQVTISAGSSSVQLDVETIDDATTELTESFRVSLSSPVNATFTSDYADATLNDNDGLPSIFIVDAPAVDEGHTALFVVSLSNISATNVTFNYETLDDTAVAPGDFNAVTAQPAVINAGELAVTIAIITNTDAKDEVGTEYFKVSLTSVAGANHGNIIADGAINDLNSEPLLYISDATAGEDSLLQFVVSIDSESEREVTFSYQTYDGTDPDKAEAAQSDYSAVSSSGAIPAGTMSITLDIPALNDDIYEPVEKMTVSLSALSFATVGDDVGEGRITDMDVQPSLAMYLVSSPTLTEGETATYLVSLSHLSALPVTVDVATITMSAREIEDYTPISAAQLTISSLSFGKTFDVFTTEDAIYEDSEQFVVSLSNPSGAMGEPHESIWITDDDDRSYIYVADTSVTEGGTAYFVVSLDKPSGFDVIFNLDTGDGTATTADADYQTVSGTFTIVEGGLSIAVGVDTNPDSKFELAEEFTVGITWAAGTWDGDSTGTGTILNDDPAPSLTIFDASATEGDALEFVISLNAQSGVDAIVDWSALDGTASEADSDYILPSLSQATITAGSLTEEIQVVTQADGVYELNESITVTLTSELNASRTNFAATGTINNNDSLPLIDIEPAAATEGAPINFVVTVTPLTGAPVYFSWQTFDESAGSGDYSQQMPALAASIPLGHQSITISVGTTADDIYEGAESFRVSLSALNHADSGSMWNTMSITSDDAPPGLVIIPPGGGFTSEGEEAIFTVTLSGPSEVAAEFYWRTFLSGSTSAADFTEVSSTKVTIPAGQQTIALSVQTTEDNIAEHDQPFLVSLTADFGTSTESPYVTQNISDDDLDPTIAVIDPMSPVTEGANLLFVISISHPSEKGVGFSYQTADGSAKAGDDYSPVSPTAGSIPADKSAITISVMTVDDQVYESAQTFHLNLSELSNLQVAGNDLTGDGGITDNEPMPSIFVEDVTSVTENEMLNFVVSINTLSDDYVNFNFQTSNAGASAGSDYSPVNSSYSIDPGNWSVTIGVQILEDTADEPNETFGVNLGGVSGATFGDGSAIGTITDDDAAGASMIYVSNPVSSEGSDLTFVISLDANAGSNISFDYTLIDGSASYPSDLSGLAKTGTGQIITSGSSSTTLVWTVTDDGLYEDAETITLQITNVNPVLTRHNGGYGTATIPANGTPPNLYVSDAEVSEGGTIIFVVSTTATAGNPISVQWSTLAGTAIDTDWAGPSSGWLTIAAGNWFGAITIPTVHDLAPEEDEAFLISLSAPLHANLLDPVGVGIIRDNDTPPDIFISDASTGEVATAQFVVSLSRPYFDEVIVSFSTEVGSGAAPATGPTTNADFTPIPSGAITIPAGSITRAINVTILNNGSGGDSDFEDYRISLTTASAGVVADNAGFGLIMNTHGTGAISQPQLNVAAAEAPEGQPLLFTVSLVGVSALPVTFSWETMTGTADTDDFEVGSGQATIAAGATSTVITVPTRNLPLLAVEGVETMTLTITSPANATISISANIGTIQDMDCPDTGWCSQSYFKAFYPDANDSFGSSSAVDGDVVAVSARNEDSNQSFVINGTRASADNSMIDAGAAYVFRRSGYTWIQEAYLKPGDPFAADMFGNSLALSGDTIVVGAKGEDSASTSIISGTSGATGTGASASGAAYVFVRSGTTWHQQATLKAPDSAATWFFGESVAIKDDTIVVGATGEGARSGAIYVFDRTGSDWNWTSRLKAPNPGASDLFGTKVAIGRDTIVVSAPEEDSNQSFVTNGEGVVENDGSLDSGAAYVFAKTGTWMLQSYLKPPNPGSGDKFGTSVAISGDTIVVGSESEDSNQSTVTNGTTASGDNSNTDSGAAYVFRRSGVTWTQEAYLKASNNGGNDHFGNTVAISGDRIAVSAYYEDSLEGTRNNGTAPGSDTGSNVGAIYVFSRIGSTWSQTAYLKAPNRDSSDYFGYSLALDGDTLVSGVFGEDGGKGGVTNGPWATVDGTKLGSGAAYVFYLKGGTSVIVQQAEGQADPTSDLPIVFDVKFSKPIDPATFNTVDVTQGGTASGINWSITNSGDNRNFVLKAEAVTGTGTVIPVIDAGGVEDQDGKVNMVSSPNFDNSVTKSP